MFTRRDSTNSSQPQPEETPIRTPSSYSPPSPVATSAPAPAPAPSTPVAGSAAGSAAESIIASEDTFEGQLRTTTGVRILGTVLGSIDSERSVRIESGARVEADISANEVVIAGTYSGALTCRNRVEITATGHVTGKVDTEKLYLHEGGFFDGELRMRRSGEEATSTPEAEAARPRRSRYVSLAGGEPVEERVSEVGASDSPAS